MDHIERLIEAGLLQPDPEGRFPAGEVAAVRMSSALETGGISIDDLIYSVQRGLPLRQSVPVGSTAPPAGRTFEEFAASLGPRAALLPEIYAAFGVGFPPPQTWVLQDEVDAIGAFLDLWAVIDDDPDVYQRAARIAGEGTRSILLSTLDLFDERGGPPPGRIQRGMTPSEAVEPSRRLGPALDRVLVWLRGRQLEDETFGRIVTFTQRDLINAGRAPERDREPDAIAFVDLSGYTEATASSGDQRAVEYATTLQALARTATAEVGGRVVKLLGDGVMLRFDSGVRAVAAVRRLMPAILGAGLPPAHAGIAVGPVIARDGDVYGHTVNLAARIASFSGPGELLVAAELGDALAAQGIPFTPAGSATLRGVPEPVPLLRIEPIATVPSPRPLSARDGAIR